MRPARLVWCSVAAMFAIACGGGGGEENPILLPDARVFMDAPVQIPVELTGLGKRCVIAMGGADCPNGAPGCLGPFVQGGVMGICTNICVPNGTFMTDAMAAPINILPADGGASQDATCAASYMGAAVGTPACEIGGGGILFNRLPAGALVATSSYTFQVACGIGCGPNGTCPGTLTCNTALNFCEPL